RTPAPTAARGTNNAERGRVPPVARPLLLVNDRFWYGLPVDRSGSQARPGGEPERRPRRSRYFGRASVKDPDQVPPRCRTAVPLGRQGVLSNQSQDGCRLLRPIR